MLGARGSAIMDRLGKRALEQVELADAEFALLREEQVLRDLLATNELTVEAAARIQRLRETVARLLAKRSQAADGYPCITLYPARFVRSPGRALDLVRHSLEHEHWCVV